MELLSHSCWKPLEIAALATRALPWESLHAATRDAASNTVGGSESAEPTSASQERKRDSAAPDSTARVAAIHRHRLLANYSESAFLCTPARRGLKAAPPKANAATRTLPPRSRASRSPPRALCRELRCLPQCASRAERWQSG